MTRAAGPRPHPCMSPPTHATLTWVVVSACRRERQGRCQIMRRNGSGQAGACRGKEISRLVFLPLASSDRPALTMRSGWVRMSAEWAEGARPSVWLSGRLRNGFSNRSDRAGLPGRKPGRTTDDAEALNTYAHARRSSPVALCTEAHTPTGWRWGMVLGRPPVAILSPFSHRKGID